MRGARGLGQASSRTHHREDEGEQAAADHLREQDRGERVRKPWDQAPTNDSQRAHGKRQEKTQPRREVMASGGARTKAGKVGPAVLKEPGAPLDVPAAVDPVVPRVQRIAAPPERGQDDVRKAEHERGLG